MPSNSTYTAEYRRFLKALVNARLDAGLSQKDVAEKLNRPQSYVSRYESGQTRIDVVELVRVSIAIGFDAAAMVALIEGAIRDAAGTEEQ